MSAPARLRCAIYTRKSTEEGLDQAFNSLHAQREACEAYIRSQVGEGWRPLPNLYDDGGISGGTMERPSLTALLRDIEAGRVDVVVVYKVDRLTRSLADFAKIVEIFDRHGVSFVSVTQAFNTTTSMGRLTLNVLLSFAQFEREVTGERIRDKIAASKRKGLWMGGNLPLGYDADGRVLAVNEAEAQQVRAIFVRYLELGSVYLLRDELAAQGVASKRRTTRTGKVLGGGPMNRGALLHLLSNRVYVGQITHKEQSFPGQHAAIVPNELFEAVQQRLASQTRRRDGDGRGAPSSPLVGKLFDGGGERMSPAFAYGRGAKLYRYYVSSPLQHGDRSRPGHIRRLPADPTEAFVLDQVIRLAGLSPGAGWEEARVVLVGVEARPEEVLLKFDSQVIAPEGDDPDQALGLVKPKLAQGERIWLESDGSLAVTLPVRLARRGGRTWMVGAERSAGARPRYDRKLIAALRKAHAALRRADASPLQPALALKNTQSISDPYERKLVRLAFLAPDIQAAIVAGRQPAGLNLKLLIAEDMPGSWDEQRRRFGFRAG